MTLIRKITRSSALVLNGYRFLVALMIFVMSLC